MVRFKKAEKDADEQSKRMRNENFCHFVLSKENDYFIKPSDLK